jgi:hypothetical protein
MKHLTPARGAIICALALTLTPAAAMATTAGTGDTAYQTERDDDDFDWGLLGLLGLAGLLGLKRKDDDVHVDARRDNNNR